MDWYLIFIISKKGGKADINQRNNEKNQISIKANIYAFLFYVISIKSKDEEKMFLVLKLFK